MLSHLVGAANRADIQRLQALEAERAALVQKLEDQAQAMLDAIQAKDAQITTLRDAVDQPRVPDVSTEIARLQDQVAESLLVGECQHPLCTCAPSKRAALDGGAD